MVRCPTGEFCQSSLIGRVGWAPVLGEAVRTGLKRDWPERAYPTILAVVEKMTESLLEKDAKQTVQWYLAKEMSGSIADV